MFHIAVCDDLQRDREEICLVLKEELEAFDADARFIKFGSGNALLKAWEKKKIDFHIVFLDIFMEGLDGIETARRLRASGYKEAIIFLTTTQDFAIEGYEVDAAGYLLKPLEKIKLRQLLKRLFKREKPALITLRQGNKVYTFAPSEIVYIESNRNRLSIHTVKETIFYYGRLDEIEKILPEKSFLRCHQSFLVNMDRVYGAKDVFHMETGDLVPIRVRERRAIREAYFRYMTERNL
ncbi:response regulator [Lachnospiraceae bacterium WCA-9-b2]|uniref:Stage 0 sporulation protein A homolog n=1 Tax=Sporofaciens musculi TaxID=2681861 RepID=A0A7X3MGG2_9FIRM|nr:LytTR family DNA-binding domain-containing protein [Sporofaciens musculi]MXP75936.1 response regulator [Sporofaciens musculi]